MHVTADALAAPDMRALVNPDGPDPFDGIDPFAS